MSAPCVARFIECSRTTLSSVIVNRGEGEVAQGNLRCLLCRIRQQRCAVRLRHVVEIMRPLPLQPIAGTAEFVLGVALIRGVPTPVLDCGALLGETAPPQHTRWVTIRCAERVAALALEDVLGVRQLPAQIDDLPPLLRGNEAIDAIASLDAELVLVLGDARLVPDSLWLSLERQAATP